MLEKFYAVTRTSIYRVQAQGQGRSSAVKIAVRGRSQIPVATDIIDGGMVAISERLRSFIPESHHHDGVQPKPKTGGHWLFQTSTVVALFFDEGSAAACLSVGDGRTFDRRWIASTRAVLSTIGRTHPSFFVFLDDVPGFTNWSLTAA